MRFAAGSWGSMSSLMGETCPVCGVSATSTWDDGLRIDESTWDGADIFRLHEDVAGFIATGKVRAIVEREGFTGVAFTPAEEFADPYPDSKARRPA